MMGKSKQIRYSSKVMIGKTPKDQEAIEEALMRGRKLHIEIVDSDLRVIDIACYIGTARYKERDFDEKKGS